MSEEKQGINIELKFTDQHGNTLACLEMLGVTHDNFSERLAVIYSTTIALVDNFDGMTGSVIGVSGSIGSN